MPRALLLLLSLSLLSCGGRAQGSSSDPAAATKADGVSRDSAATAAHVLFVGDIMQHDAQIAAAWDSARHRHCYESYFRYLGALIGGADLAVCNFEVTLGGKPYKGYPTFSAPDEYLDDLRAAGFDVFLTANNHCLDKGQKGLERTIARLRDSEVAHIGTYEDSIDRELRYPALLRVGAVNVVILNYTYGTNGLKPRGGNVVNYIDRSVMARDIARARALRPHFIVACVHWGVEYQTTPNAEQRELARWLVDQGVDHVIGGHPHVVQPFELLTTPDGRRHVVAYSLGNFVSNQNKPGTTGGMVVGLTLDRSDYDATARGVWWMPFHVANPNTCQVDNYVAVPPGANDGALPKDETAAAETFAAEVRKTILKGAAVAEKAYVR